MFHFINNEIFPEAEANILTSDLSILRGFGVFDYLRTYNRKPFLLNSYLNRFFNSASIAGLKVPFHAQKIESIIDELISLNDYEECGIRLVLTGGYSNDGYKLASPNFIIRTEKFSVPGEKVFRDGVNIISFEHQREFPEAKLLNYSASMIFNLRNVEKAAKEILYFHHGKITEASRSNFFIIQGNRLITARDQILKGITRQTVLSLVPKDLIVEESQFPIQQLSFVDESFITSTTKGILPVIKVDNTVIGNGKVGEKTLMLMKRYEKFVKSF